MLTYFGSAKIINGRVGRARLGVNRGIDTATIRAHVFSYLRRRSPFPPHPPSPNLRYVSFCSSGNYGIGVTTLSRSLFSNKDVRVELNQAIGLNNSPLNEFVTSDVGIPKYSTPGDRESTSRKCHVAHIFILNRRHCDLFIYCLLFTATSLYVYICPHLTLI